jgi:Inositol monophosphatase family
MLVSSFHINRIFSVLINSIFDRRSWDVCAGIVIAREAGCVVAGSHAAFSESCANGTFGDVTTEILLGRKFLVVRAVMDIPVGDHLFLMSTEN